MGKEPYAHASSNRSCVHVGKLPNTPTGVHEPEEAIMDRFHAAEAIVRLLFHLAREVGLRNARTTSLREAVGARAYTSARRELNRLAHTLPCELDYPTLHAYAASREREVPTVHDALMYARYLRDRAWASMAAEDMNQLLVPSAQVA